MGALPVRGMQGISGNTALPPEIFDVVVVGAGK